MAIVPSTVAGHGGQTTHKTANGCTCGSDDNDFSIHNLLHLWNANLGKFSRTPPSFDMRPNCVYNTIFLVFLQDISVFFFYEGPP